MKEKNHNALKKLELTKQIYKQNKRLLMMFQKQFKHETVKN